MELARDLGVPLVHKKAEGPTTVLTFLCIELDTIHQVSWLPEVKLRVLQAHEAYFKSRNKVSLHLLQQLVGHLNFSCRVIAPGCAFLVVTVRYH